MYKKLDFLLEIKCLQTVRYRSMFPQSDEQTEHHNGQREQYSEDLSGHNGSLNDMFKMQDTVGQRESFPGYTSIYVFS